MKILCKSATGKGLLEFTLKHKGDTIHTKYSVKVGETYVVYGQMIFSHALSYLILGTYEELPSWYPAELFEVVDTSMPLEWHYNYYEEIKLNAIWGFKELVTDLNFYEGLIDKEDWVFDLFLKRKEEIDKFS